MIYLHIINSVTNITDLQQNLYANRNKLLKQGLFYPPLGIEYWGHDNILLDLSKEPNFIPKYGSAANLKLLLLNYKMKFPKGNVMISLKYRNHKAKKLWKRFVELLRKIDKVTVIIHLENPLIYLKKFWLVKTKKEVLKINFSDWASWFIESNISGMDYLERIRPFEEMNIEVQIIIQNNHTRQEVTNNLLNCCNVQWQEDFLNLFLGQQPFVEEKFDIPLDVIELFNNRFLAKNNTIAKKYFNRDILFI